PWKMVLGTSYVGSRTRKYPISANLNVVPLAQQVESLGVSNYWNRTVANPFFGAPEMAGTPYAGATVTNAALATPFPQFSGVQVQGLPFGRATYDALEARLDKRLTYGLSFSVSYTLSKNISALSYRNDWTTTPLRQIDALDVTHHFTMATFWDVPF